MPMMRLVKYLLVALPLALLSCGDDAESKDLKWNSKDAQKDTLNVLQHYVQDVDSIDQMIMDAPGDLNLYAIRANIHFSYGFYDEAVADIERVITRDSTNVKYLSQAAQIYFGHKEVEKAKKQMDRILALDPNNADNLLQLAELEFLQGQYARALDLIDASLKINLNNGNAYLLKGFIFLEKKDTAKAASSFETAREQGNLVEANIELARLYGGIMDLRALNYCDNAINANPTNAEALYLKGYYAQTFALDMFKEDTAVQHYHVNMAESAYQALFSLSEQIQLDTYQATFVQKGYFNYGYLYLVYARDYPEAAKLFDIAFRLNPKDFKAVYHRGLAQEAMEEYEKALADYNLALQIDPTYGLAAKSKEIVLQKMR